MLSCFFLAAAPQYVNSSLAVVQVKMQNEVLQTYDSKFPKADTHFI